MSISSEQLSRIQEAEESGGPMATCPACNLHMPATKEFWYIKGRERSELCKECTRQQSTDKLALGRKDRSLLKKVIKGQLLETGNAEHLYEECLQQFGGLRPFVAELKLLYDEANAESTKLGVLRMIFRLASDADKSRKTDMLSTLIEEEDLHRAAVAIEGEMSKGLVEEHDAGES
jgi:hypothetical protein